MDPLQISYPPDLPVSGRRDEILEAIRANQVVIIAGSTGSGKTTALRMMDDPVRFISTVQVGITVVGIALGAIGEPLIGRFLIYDALRMRFRELKLRKDADCPVCGTHPSVTMLIV